MTDTEQQLAVLVAQLPPHAQAELLDFAEFLRERHRQPHRAITARELLAEPPTEVSFHTADDVRAYLNNERDAWER